jgi:hypothetical protein
VEEALGRLDAEEARVVLLVTNHKDDDPRAARAGNLEAGDRQSFSYLLVPDTSGQIAGSRKDV